jgi:hypothetical protein
VFRFGPAEARSLNLWLGRRVSLYREALDQSAFGPIADAPADADNAVKTSSELDIGRQN